MDELLKDVLIKEASGIDKVILVDNLPKSLLYKKDIKMVIDYSTPYQHLVPAYELDGKGNRINTGELVEVLKEGIERSQTGDGAFVFNVNYNESKQRLQELDRYIAMSVPQADRIPERVPYAAQPGVMTSGTIARNQIPRVVLPELVSPPVLATAQVTPTRVIENLPENPANRVIMTEEMKKQATKERMAKARAARKA